MYTFVSMYVFCLLVVLILSQSCILQVTFSLSTFSPCPFLSLAIYSHLSSYLPSSFSFFSPLYSSSFYLSSTLPFTLLFFYLLPILLSFSPLFHFPFLSFNHSLLILPAFSPALLPSNDPCFSPSYLSLVSTPTFCPSLYLCFQPHFANLPRLLAISFFQLLIDLFVSPPCSFSTPQHQSIHI